ncbi:MAG: BMP family ABC transporter substrate-binding protein [Spirochaetes bacterium]|nr:BMP family ABC transporter substrate-binding protein [Spirochaetota bacterium]
MRKIFIILIIIFILIFSIIWLKAKGINKKYNYKIALVINDVGDNAFADLQVKALEFLEKRYKLRTHIYLCGTFDKTYEYMEKAIKDGYNIIIGGNGIFSEEPIKNLAKVYNNIYFISIDNDIKEHFNKSCSLTFKQNEASFLAGVLAAKLSKVETIGFLGGMDIDVINDFFLGFQQGVEYIDKNKKVKAYYINKDCFRSSEQPFNDKELGSYLVERFYKEFKVDIIYCVAGGSNLGAYEKIKILPIYGIGVDTDQDHFIPGKILFSVLKNIDIGIIFIVSKIISGQFEPKNYRLGLKENGVGLSEMKYTRNLIGNVNLNLIEDLRLKIIKGEIVVKSKF